MPTRRQRGVIYKRRMDVGQGGKGHLRKPGLRGHEGTAADWASLEGPRAEIRENGAVNL